MDDIRDIYWQRKNFRFNQKFSRKIFTVFSYFLMQYAIAKFVEILLNGVASQTQKLKLMLVIKKWKRRQSMIVNHEIIND